MNGNTPATDVLNPSEFPDGCGCMELAEHLADLRDGDDDE